MTGRVSVDDIDDVVRPAAGRRKLLAIVIARRVLPVPVPSLLLPAPFYCPRHLRNGATNGRRISQGIEE